jgi:ribulose-phosphate 3-epimerase
MEKMIVPALIAKNQKELDERFGKVKSLGKEFHLDVMDGQFVKNKSLLFDFKLPRGNKYWAHLMMKAPGSWLSRNFEKVHGVIVHAESENLKETIEFAKRKKKKVGIAINPWTSVGEIENYLDKIDMVLVMTVQPGKYGANFLVRNLGKIKSIKKIGRKIIIGVDGGIDDNNIGGAAKVGASYFSVGSYLQKASDPKEAFARLKRNI